jgi:hypothetical protein
MNLFVMAGLVPAIHALAHKTWMPATSVDKRGHDGVERDEK